jgi:hypothetical protein
MGELQNNYVEWKKARSSQKKEHVYYRCILKNFLNAN